MAHKGFLDPNTNRIEDLLRSIVTTLASDQTRLALWLIDEFDFSQLSGTCIIGDASPFPKSSSKLAGFGYLLPMATLAVDSLIDVLTGQDQLDCYILHLEIEVEGNVAFSSYDTFNCIFFNDPVELAFIEELKQRSIINDYGTYEHLESISTELS